MESNQELQAKYTLDIRPVDKAIATPKELAQELKGAVSGKQLARMKKEAVECPVLVKTVSFVQCFACPNFIRRVKGQVGCRGLPLPAAKTKA